MELLLPPSVPELMILVPIGRLRQTMLPGDAAYGPSSSLAAGDARVLETSGGTNLHPHRGPCSQMVVLGRTKFLV